MNALKENLYSTLNLMRGIGQIINHFSIWNHILELLSIVITNQSLQAESISLNILEDLQTLINLKLKAMDRTSVGLLDEINQWMTISETVTISTTSINIIFILFPSYFCFKVPLFAIVLFTFIFIFLPPFVLSSLYTIVLSH